MFFPFPRDQNKRPPKLELDSLLLVLNQRGSADHHFLSVDDVDTGDGDLADTDTTDGVDHCIAEIICIVDGDIPDSRGIIVDGEEGFVVGEKILIGGVILRLSVVAAGKNLFGSPCTDHGRTYNIRIR